MGNLIHDNGNRDAPALAFEWAAQGNGIILAGGQDSYVARNRVVNHPQNGIAVFPILDANSAASSEPAGGQMRQPIPSRQPSHHVRRPISQKRLTGISRYNQVTNLGQRHRQQAKND